MSDKDLKFMNKQDVERYRDFARKALGVEFKDISILITAFTHRSYVNEHKKTARSHNERLEFLGDAVLELAVTDYLYSNFKEPEGVLTNWRSSLVRTESISAAGAKAGFEDLLRLSRGEKNGTERARAQILANSYEAVLGALYLDQGYKPCVEFINKTLIVTFPQILKSGSWQDAKSKLQEVAQEKKGATPVYKVLKEEGPDHDKIFEIGVFVANKLYGQGSGPSKQIAQQQAANVALKEISIKTSVDRSKLNQ
jgi:ribonuclease-3